MQFPLSQFKDPYFKSWRRRCIFCKADNVLPLGLGVTDPFIVVTQQLGCHLHAVGWQLLSRGRANMLCSRSSREDLSIVFALPFPVFGNSRCVQEAQKLAWKGKSVARCVTIGLLL